MISDSELTSELKFAANAALKRITGEIQDEVPVLMSGAGHDAMAMSHLTKASSFILHELFVKFSCSYNNHIHGALRYGQVGMLFVRCRGGVSHSPAEHVLDDDVWAAGLAILAFLEMYV